MAHEIPSQHRPGQSSPDSWPRAFNSSFAINKRGRCQNTGEVRDLLDLLAAGMGIKPAEHFVFLQVAKQETRGSETAFLVVLLKLVAAMQRKTLPEELVCLPPLALIQD